MLFARRRRRLARILLVEDEPLVAFDAEHQLQDAGFEIVATVDTVFHAVAHLESGVAIDLVLADVRLADGSGLDVARTAAELEIPVMFVTGDCPPEARGLAHGWLAKPYRQRDLVHAIEAIEARMLGKAPRRVPESLRLFLPEG